MNNYDDPFRMLSLLQTLQSYEHGTIPRNYLNNTNSNDYGEELKKVLKESHIVYVFPNNDNPYLSSRVGDLNIKRFQHEYNPNRMNIWKINHITKMVYNSGTVFYYPYSFEKLVNFFDKRNINANVSLVQTKYHYWDDDLDAEEIFNEYENGDFYEKQQSLYMSRPRILNKITRTISLGNLKSRITLYLSFFNSCRVYFIAIKADNGLTYISELFSPLLMLGCPIKDGILEVIDKIENSENSKSEEGDEENTSTTTSTSTIKRNTKNKKKKNKKKNNKKKKNRK